MNPRTAVAPSKPSPDFSTDLQGVAHHLRTTLSSLMVSAGLDPQDPQALTRQWGLNRQLSWKISKVIQLRDPYLALQHLPGGEGLGILFRKGEEAAVPVDLIDATRHAAQEFDRLIETHCGDRSIFDIMGSALSSAEPARQQQETLRKQFFLGASSIWGAQTRVNLVTWFIAPSERAGGQPKTVDLVNIKAWLGFRRLRDNLSWVISRHVNKHDDGTSMAMRLPEPLDPRSSPDVPLMRDFCSDLLPEISVHEDSEGTTVSLAPGPVGKAGEIACVFGRIHRDLPHFRSAQDRLSQVACRLNVPNELTIFDLFVHESMGYAKSPAVSLASRIVPRDPAPERSQLPLHEPLIELGSLTHSPLTLDVPRYAEMIELACSRMGWSRDAFTGFRMRMAYPPMPAVLTMQYELPEAP